MGRKAAFFLYSLFLISSILLSSGCKKQNDSSNENNNEEENIINLVDKYANISVRIDTKLSDEQVEFINKHYSDVMTPILSNTMRENITAPLLYLYRSIQGTWENFNHFDWDHIDANENMFCHHNGERIKTIFDSWLMDGSDLVDPNSEDRLNHWINYYAETASSQVKDYDYDGLFIDSASHRLSPSVVNGIMPDNYSDEEWKKSRYRALKFIKSYLPNKKVVFNGLHSDNGANKSLDFTDGGIWEIFAYNTSTGEYYGQKSWENVMKLANYYCDKKLISIVSKKKGLTEDVGTRLFIHASYLLVHNKNVRLYISDLNYSTKEILYYPEYMVDMGNPGGDYYKSDGLFLRKFENGLVIVNPSENSTLTYSLDKQYKKIEPSGGGKINSSADWNGKVYYTLVSGEIKLEPQRAVILLN